MVQSLYNAINCKLYPDKKNLQYIKVRALDNYKDEIKEKLCKQLEKTEVLKQKTFSETPIKYNGYLDNIYNFNKKRPIFITYPDEKNYGNEYENVYDENYLDIYEPFEDNKYSYNEIIIVVLIASIAVLYYIYKH